MTNIDQLPGNSKLGKPAPPAKEAKVVEKVVDGIVIEKKKSLGAKFKATFFNKADAKDISTYILFDVMLPATRNLVYDIVSKGASRALFGQDSPRRSVLDRSGGSRVSYNDSYGTTRYRDAPRSSMLPGQPPHYRAKYERSNNFDDIIVSSKAEAERVVERLLDIVDKYDVATVADLRNLLGLPSSHVDNKWGWTDIRAADVRQVREGYLIEIPLPEPI
jgi:hypothetical protein